MTEQRAQPGQEAPAGEPHVSPALRTGAQINQGQMFAQILRNLPLPPDERPKRSTVASSALPTSLADSSGAEALEAASSCALLGTHFLNPRPISRERQRISLGGLLVSLPWAPRPLCLHFRQVVCPPKRLSSSPTSCLSEGRRRAVCAIPRLLQQQHRRRDPMCRWCDSICNPSLVDLRAVGDIQVEDLNS